MSDFGEGLAQTAGLPPGTLFAAIFIPLTFLAGASLLAGHIPVR
jgi:hypothetical protein